MRAGLALEGCPLRRIVGAGGRGCCSPTHWRAVAAGVIDLRARWLAPNGPRGVVDQSNARILAPMSPPPANTDSINCVLIRSMAESLDSATALSAMDNRVDLFSLVIEAR